MQLVTDVGLPLTLGSASASAGGAIAVRGSTMWNTSSTMLLLGSDSVDRCAQALFMCEYLLGALRLCRSCRRCLGQEFFLGAADDVDGLWERSGSLGVVYLRMG